MKKTDSPEKTLRETHSLTDFKQAMWLYLDKFTRSPMNEEDFKVPRPLALLAFKEGQARLTSHLKNFLEEPDNG